MSYKFPPLEAARDALIELQASGVTMRSIEEVCGLGIPFQSAFREYRSADPAYTRIVTLFNYLAENHGEVLARHVEIHEAK